MSPARENLVLTAILLGVLVAASAYGYYLSHPQVTQSEPLIGNLQLRSTSVGIDGLNPTRLGLNVKAVVYNPNGFGATLDSANYSVYVDGRYLGSGQTTGKLELAAQSSQTFVLPVSVGWTSGLRAAGRYLLDLGHVSWEVKGNMDVSIGGLSLSVPFELTSD